MNVNVVRSPEVRFENLPDWHYAPHYIDDIASYAGLRMHYVDEGRQDDADKQVTFLCIHGEPTWAYLFRKMAPVFLSAGHRFVAPDMFGFGRSDKPLDDETYTYHFHRNSLLEFVERLDLNNICLVVQDWGGLLGLTLPMASASRYTRLLVMNTALPAGESAGKGFAGWREYNRTQPDLDIAALIKRSTSVLTDNEAAAYAAPFPDKSFKAGVRRFPELVMLRENEETGLTPLAEEGVESSLKAREFWSNDWEGESFMAIGMQDPVLGPPVMQALHKCIKNCPAPMEIPEAGHFVQEWGKEIAEVACDAFKLR